MSDAQSAEPEAESAKKTSASTLNLRSTLWTEIRAAVTVPTESEGSIQCRQRLGQKKGVCHSAMHNTIHHTHKGCINARDISNQLHYHRALPS